MVLSTLLLCSVQEGALPTAVFLPHTAADCCASALLAADCCASALLLLLFRRALSCSCSRARRGWPPCSNCCMRGWGCSPREEEEGEEGLASLQHLVHALGRGKRRKGRCGYSLAGAG